MDKLNKKYYKHEYFKGQQKISADEFIVELEQQLQQYKLQIDELEKEIDRIWNLDEVDFYSEKYEKFLSKLKEHDKESE